MRLRGALQTRGEPWDECINLTPPPMHPTYNSFFLSGDRKTLSGWRRGCDWLACRNDTNVTSTPPGFSEGGIGPAAIIFRLVSRSIAVESHTHPIVLQPMERSVAETGGRGRAAIIFLRDVRDLEIHCRRGR